MSILAQAAVTLLEGKFGCTVSRLFVGAFMTSFDIVSITILNLTGALGGKKSTDYKPLILSCRHLTLLAYGFSFLEKAQIEEENHQICSFRKREGYQDM